MTTIEPGGNKIVVIAGAGPAGLTAALELLRHSNIAPIVFEADDQVGGLSKTINFRGNLMDLGGHRFFSKSDWVMRWWQGILPVAEGEVSSPRAFPIHYQGQSCDFTPESLARASEHSVMLVRSRLSRILYRRRFFDYPLALNPTTIRNLGIIETLLIGLSYGRAKLFPRVRQYSLEDFLVNRFGNRLYLKFFRDYTEKVWGVPCREISAEWGIQRIKGLSVAKVISHALSNPIRRLTNAGSQHVETSLIDRFLYPKCGPGQMWEEVARRVTAMGGRISVNHRVVGIERKGFEIEAIVVKDLKANAIERVPCDFFISSMPVGELIAMLGPDDLRTLKIAEALPYRDFMSAGILLRRMNKMRGQRASSTKNNVPPDNWIYVQEPDVRVGRIQIFNNWSPSLVVDPDTIWLGMEYFCREGDDLWRMDDPAFIEFATGELQTLGLIRGEDVIDGTVVRVPKAYPAYFGSYSEFDKLRLYLDQFNCLYPIGRNGMHRYNNQDHSMLAANFAVNAILNDGSGKSRIWGINTEQEYHEETTGSNNSLGQHDTKQTY